MIQRLQSLLMFCSAIIAGCVSFFCPLARLTVTAGFTQDLTGWSYLPLGIVLAMVSVLTLGDIFLFRKRALQMRVMTFTIILLVAWYALYGYAYWQLTKETGDSGMFMNVCVPAALPFCCLVLNYQSFRLILKDELLVRSLDRLR
ncbi:MAG: DUF4293 domain-containing protein [Bacteroidaceae bacterium]|nr:DUF4293 domain-containing protein [Bacteroidaceae bacterium]